MPVSVDYRTERWPVVTFTFIGSCTALYLIGVAIVLLNSGGGKAISDPLVQGLGLIPARGDVINWITHMFVHGGLFHLVGNMVFLFLFGSVVEDTMGRSRFVIFYLVGGLVAAAAHFFIEGTADRICLVGASGAISACLGGFLFLYAKTQIEFKYFVWFFFYVRAGGFHVVSWVVISFWFLRDLVSLAHSMQNDSGGGGIAFGAHLGGMLAGFVIVAAGSRFRRSPNQRERDLKVRIEMPRNVYVYHDEQQIGPFSKEQVGQMRATGALNSKSLYWMDGMVDWLPVEDL